MQKNKNWLGINMSILAIVAVILAVYAFSSGPSEIIPEGYVVDDGITQTSLDALGNEAKGIIDGLNVQVTDLTNKLATKVTEEVEEAKELAGYLIDELFLSIGLAEETYSDREVKTLFDGEVSFDGDDYDVEETLILEGIELVANGNDFEGNVYATFPENSVEYKVTFEDGLNTSLIGIDEEYLEFMFLGMNYEISDWSEDFEIILTKGTEVKLLVGGSLTVDGKEVSLFAIDESGDKASLIIDGVDKVFKEGDVKTVNGIEVKVDTIFDSETSSYVKIIVGEEIERTIEDGEEYEEDPAWEYVITANSIGVSLVEDLDEVDLDVD